MTRKTRVEEIDDEVELFTPTGQTRPRNPDKVDKIHKVLHTRQADGKLGTYADAGRAVGLSRSGARFLYLRWKGRAAHRVHAGKNVRSPNFESA